MTSHDQLDLFSPAQRRERLVDWQVPAPVAKVAMGLSGMDAMLGIRDGKGALAVHATATFSMIGNG